LDFNFKSPIGVGLKKQGKGNFSGSKLALLMTLKKAAMKPINAERVFD